MADFRVPGPIGTSSATMPGDGGTNQCRLSPTPGSVGSGGGVETMSLEDRFVSVLYRTTPKLPAEIQEEFAAMLSPASIAVIVGVLVVWAGSHYFGIGFIADAVLLIAGLGFLGWQVWSVGGDFVSFVEITYSARTEQQLESASKHLANFIAVVGVAAFMALIAKGAKRVGPKVKNMRGIVKAATAADAGMPPNHFSAFSRAAANPDLPRIIMVRQTNPKSLPLIRRGFPAKPREIKMKTSGRTGIVTCDDIGEVRKARQTIRSGSNKQYFVVDRNRRTATNGKGESIDVSNADWTVEPGQVIDPVAQKPLVGDYDLMAVIDPNAKGRNLALAVDNTANARAGRAPGSPVEDFSNPDIRAVARDINQRLDQPRVLHGSHETFDSVQNLKADEIVVGFFPDGTALSFNRAGLKEFYNSIGRSTLDLKQKFDL